MARKIKLTIITEQQYQTGLRAFRKLTCPGAPYHEGGRDCGHCGDQYDELITALHLETADTIEDSGEADVQALHQNAERIYGWRKKRAKAGYCGTCGKRKARKNRKTCQKCADAAKERVAKARAGK